MRDEIEEEAFDEEEAPPVTPATEYISEAGFRRLAVELDRLVTQDRPAVVENVASAAAEGDRSENAEYIYGKRRLREIDKRIAFLTRRLDRLTPVPRAGATDRVVFLSFVQVQDEDTEQTRWFRLVGADETDGRQGWISYRSPVGQGLLGKRLEDEVIVSTPSGEKVYTILAIRADAPA
jgi:transcription elongation factor GreB